MVPVVVAIVVLMVGMVEDVPCNDSNRAVESLTSFLDALFLIPSGLSKAPGGQQALVEALTSHLAFSGCYQLPLSLGAYSMASDSSHIYHPHNILQA